MSSKQKLFKSVRGMFDSTKDNVINSVVTMVNEGKINVNRNDLPKLINLISVKIDESFTNGSKSHEKLVNNLVLESDEVKKN